MYVVKVLYYKTLRSWKYIQLSGVERPRKETI